MSPRSRKRRRPAQPISQPTDPDLEFLERLACVFFLIMIAIAIPRYVSLAWQGLEIWFPLDEKQHYDVIDQISSGRFPNQRSLITDYTFQISEDYFVGAKPDDFDGTKEGLGVLATSYESQQPPVYYLLLAGPNALMKYLDVPPPQLVRLLRSFDVIFYLGTSLIIILIFNDLSALVGYPRMFGYFIAAFFLTTGFGFRGYISCDHLSPLIGTLTIWLMLRLWRSGNRSYIVWSALAVSLSCLTKLTNGYLLLLWFANTLVYYHRRERPTVWGMLGHTAPFWLVPLYFGIRYLALGIEGFTPRPEMIEFLKAVLPPPPSPWEAARDVTIQSLPGLLQRFGPWPALACVVIFSIHLVISGRRLIVRRDPAAFPVFLACCIAAVIVLGAASLSPHTEGFGFHRFRHYGGYVALWYTAMFAAPLLYRSRRSDIIFASLSVVLLLTLTDLW